jgi:hypothetical protein
MKEYGKHRLAVKNLFYGDIADKIFTLKPGESICLDEVEYLCCSVNSRIDFAYRESNGICVRVDHDQVIYDITLSAMTATVPGLGHVLQCTYYSYGNFLFKWQIQDADEYIKSNK